MKFVGHGLDVATDCVQAEEAPAVHHGNSLAPKTVRRTVYFQRTAISRLTDCLSLRDHSMPVEAVQRPGIKQIPGVFPPCQSKPKRLAARQGRRATKRRKLTLDSIGRSQYASSVTETGFLVVGSWVGAGWQLRPTMLWRFHTRLTVWLRCLGVRLFGGSRC